MQSRPFGVALLVAGYDEEHGPVLYVDYFVNNINFLTIFIHSNSHSSPHLSIVNYCRFHTDPSGTFVKFQAKAVGSGSEGAQTALQESYRADLTLEEAEVLALSTLKQVMEEKITATNVDIAKVAPTWHLYTTEEVQGVIGRL